MFFTITHTYYPILDSKRNLELAFVTYLLIVRSIINNKKFDDNQLFQAMTDLMTPVISRGLVYDWFNEKLPIYMEIE